MDPEEPEGGDWTQGLVRWLALRKTGGSEGEEAYYSRRAEEELSAARRSGDDDIAEIHRELASRYCRLANVEQESLGRRPGRSKRRLVLADPAPSA